MTDETQPESEWEHSHALEEGDELVDAKHGAEISVDTVHDDGAVTVRVWRDERHGQEYVRESWTEEMVRLGLRDGLLERTDGKNKELATY